MSTQTDLLGSRPHVTGLVKDVSREDGRTRFEAIASTEAVDRDGEVIEVAGWEWKSPLPKLLYGHSSQSVENVLGKLESIDKQDDSLRITASINDAASPAHKAAGILVRSGDLDTLSVGFEPLGWTDPDGSTHTRKAGTGWPFPEAGRRYTRQELLEVSLVGVPSNYEAVVTGMKALGGFDAASLKPYPNEHACRLREPGDFQADSFRRTTRNHEGRQYSVISGKLKGESSMTEQAYRYPKDTWTAAQARSHCSSHDGRFDAASGGQNEYTGPLESWERELIERFMSDFESHEWAVRLGLRVAEAQAEGVAKTMQAAHEFAALLQRLEASATRAE